jgi:endogenous inhibitor of DNA gyrase (YacG/DUF329 family)
VSFLRGIEGSGPLRAEPVTRDAGPQERRIARSGTLGTGTLACPRCDAPVVLMGGPASPRDELTCPFCSHHATLSDFLSLAAPTRPARVEVRVLQRRPLAPQEVT